MITLFKPRPGLLLFLLILVAGGEARAFPLFPSARDRAERQLQRADRMLTRADSAYAGGNPDQARALYENALKQYRDLNQTAPDLRDGLPRYRVTYCEEQLQRISQKLVADAGTVFTQVMAAGETNSAAVPPGAGPAVAEGWVPALKVVGEQNGATLAAAESPAVPAAEPKAELPPVDPEQLQDDLREARILLEDGQLADAAGLLVKVLREDPGNRSARMLIAIARARQGRYDEALVALEDLPGRNGDLPLLLALAGIYCGAGRHFDAMLLLDQAIELAPRQPQAYHNLAWLHLVMNDSAAGRRDAEAYYRRAVGLGTRRDRALEFRLGLE